jgi:DNA-binding NarL/FixJ family response regulator
LKKTIAILEPHHIFRQCLEEILGHLEYEVILKSGETLDFIEQLAVSEEHPTIIISEVQLNDMPDVSMFKHLSYHYPEIKLLAFSADNSEWAVETVMQEGAHAFLQKGCSLMEIQMILDEIVSRKSDFR